MANFLLRCVARAVLRHGLNALAGGMPLGDVLVDIANGAMEGWKKQRPEAQRRAELQELVLTPAPEVRRQAAEVVAEVAADQPLAVRQALGDYLAQIPATIARSLRRPADPTGSTMPARRQLSKAEDLLPFLPPRRPRFQPGDRPTGIGDWELVELLGIGGFGEVWKAHNPNMPGALAVALKFCLDTVAAGSLRREAALLARVQLEVKSPGIVELRHTYLRADPPCLEYEYVEGGDLGGLIHEWHADSGPTPEQAAELMLRLANIVAVTHRLHPPLVHRDLKPANILVEYRASGRGRLKVADFGIGALVAGQALREATRSGLSRGPQMTLARGSCTPLYASPQQMRGDDPDPRDDVHALGVIWYQLLTGDLGSGVPGGLHWVSELKRREMSDALIHLLASCFEAQPANRPANAVVLAEQLQALLHPAAPVTDEFLLPGYDNPSSPSKASCSLPPPPLPPRRFWRARLVCLLLVTLLGVGGVGWWYARQPPSPPPEEVDSRPLSEEELARLPSEEQVRQTVTFRSWSAPTQMLDAKGKLRFRYFLKIEAPRQVLEQIDEVVYDFGEASFNKGLWAGQRKQKPWRFTRRNREEGFEMWYNGYGYFNSETDVTLHLHNGQRVTLKCNMYEARESKE